METFVEVSTLAADVHELAEVDPDHFWTQASHEVSAKVSRFLSLP